jgi:hypothetical protein
MYTVTVPQQCGCFKRSNHEANLSFEDKDTALIEATNIAKDMNINFCGKHAFLVMEDGDNLIIAMASNG